MTDDVETTTPQTAETSCRIELVRVDERSGAPQRITDQVVVEEVVTIMVRDVGSFTFLCTPADLEALAVGFAYSEGMIDSIDDIVNVAIGKGDPPAVSMQVADPSGVATKRNMIVASSCGMCGARGIDKALSQMPPCGQTLQMTRHSLIAVTEQLQSMQDVFRRTGGSHASGIFTPDGRMIAFAEDLGRHNSLDKAIGQALLNGQDMAGCGMALSGRVTFEMVAKAARAGVELIAAVSAPSSFAIEAAERWNITLCGFVRPDRANVYTHPGRISDLFEAL